MKGFTNLFISIREHLSLLKKNSFLYKSKGKKVNSYNFVKRKKTSAWLLIPYQILSITKNF